MSAVCVEKIFNGRKIRIRELSKEDLKKPKDFLNYINSLVAEDAKILINKKFTLKQEKEWLKSVFEGIKRKKKVFCIAEHQNKIVGIGGIEMKNYRENHVGLVGISVRKGYRGIGLGKYLMKTVIDLAKRRLKVRIIRLSVFENNKIAINLYKKLGFKKVAKIPKQIQYKNKLIDEIVMILEV